MKIVLLQDVGGVGQRGTVVEVSDGYAMNSLIPQRKAEQATPEKEAAAKKRIAAEKAARESAADQLERAIQSLEGVAVELKARASEKGGLFKAIAAADNVRIVREQKSMELPESVVALAKPIKEVGEHSVPLKSERAASMMRLVVKAA